MLAEGEGGDAPAAEGDAPEAVTSTVDRTEGDGTEGDAPEASESTDDRGERREGGRGRQRNRRRGSGDRADGGSSENTEG